MTDTTVPAPRKRSWLKILGLIFGILLLLVIVLYFVVTSSGFIRSVILPKAGNSLGCEITASEVSLSPFKQIVIRELKVQPKGREPLFTCPEIKVQYRLMDIIKGNYNIDLISVSSPVISLIERPDQTSNLDPVMDAMGKEEKPKETKSEPMNLDLRKLVVTDGVVRYQKQPSAEGSYSSEITKLNVNIDGLKTGSVGKFTIDALMAMQSSAPAPGTNGSMSGNIKGAMDLGLTPMLKPSVIKGNTTLQIGEATGGYAMAKGMSAAFDADVTPTDIKQIALRLLQGQKKLGELVASGPFDMEKMEGAIDVRLSNVDRNALELFTAGSGMDFGKTAINSTNHIRMSNGGKSVAAAGAFRLSDFQATRTNQSTPVLNLQADYDVTVDQAASNAVLRTLTLSGQQSGKEFLKGNLSAPMVVNWGNGSGAGDSAFVLNVTGFNLADWKAFMGDALDSGIVNSKIDVASKQGGKQITFAHKTTISQLGMAVGSNHVSGVSIVLSGDGEAKEMEQFTSRYGFQMAQGNGGSAVDLGGSAVYNGKTEEARAEVKGTMSMPALLRIAAVQDADFSSGAAKLNLTLQKKKENQQVQGDFNLTELTGRFGSNVFQAFAAAAQMDVAMDNQKADLRKATITLSQAGKPGGTVDMSGTYGLSNCVTEFKMVLKDLNQNVLGTFLQPALGDKALQSISVNGQASANYDPAKASKIEANFKMANLVVKDPKGTIAAKPLEAGLSLDTVIDKQVTEIRKAVLSLTPTDRAKNEAQVSGRIDMSNTNATSGSLKISSDSMDLTTYYDLFQGQEAATEKPKAAPGVPAPAPGSSTKPGPETEAEPTVLPLTNFVVEASIGKFYLRELEITNLTVTTAINGGRVRVDPFQMAINGAPLRSVVNLDLGVPGYKYDITFGMTNVPFAPLVNTFTPERKGQMGGFLSAGTQIRGAGTTGASLQKNLSGNFGFATTNLNMSISELRSPMLKTVINVIAIVPSIVKNPSSGLSSLTGALFGSGTAQGSKPAGDWGDELMNSPIDVVEANGEMGSGTIKLQRAFLQSPAFQAQAQGTIQLAKVLTNSTVNIPLSISIRRPLAEKVNLVPPGTPTNAVYVKLPDYVALKGTFGEPKTDINKMALLGTALQQYGGNIPGVDQKTGNIIQGLGGILTGRKGATNAPAGTNAAPAQTNQTGGLLQGLGGILGGQSAQTNTSGATNNSATNNPVGGLIQGIFGPKKK